MSNIHHQKCTVICVFFFSFLIFCDAQSFCAVGEWGKWSQRDFCPLDVPSFIWCSEFLKRGRIFKFLDAKIWKFWGNGFWGFKNNQNDSKVAKTTTLKFNSTATFLQFPFLSTTSNELIFKRIYFTIFYSSTNLEGK